MAQHQHLFSKDVPPPTGKIGKDTLVYTKDDIRKVIWQIATSDMRSGMTGYLAGQPGYFLGYSKGVANVPDGTPVFAIGNPVGSNIGYDGTNLTITGGTFIIDVNGNNFAMCYGLQSGQCTDGNAVTFSTPYNNPPIIWFGAGGVTYDSTLPSASTTTQQQIFSATNVSGTGFTPSLKIGTATSLTTNTLTFGSLPGTTVTATLNSNVAFDNNYTYTFSYGLHGGVGATIYLRYSTSGSPPFTPVYQFNKYNSSDLPQTYNFSWTASISGLVASTSVLEIVLDTGGSGIGNIQTATATYNSSSATLHSATPSNANPVWWYAIAAPTTT